MKSAIAGLEGISPTGPTFEASSFSTIMMAAQRNSKHKKLKAKTSKGTTSSAEKAKIKTKIHKTVQADTLEVKRKRQTRIRAEVALIKPKENPAVSPVEALQEHQAQIKRVSFVVRLTVDEHGQPQRTEIEHIPSGRKQNFPNLDGIHLVTFMKACISPERISQVDNTTVNTPEAHLKSKSASAKPRSRLIVSDVQIFRRGNPDFVTLILTPEEPFMLQAHFQIQMPYTEVLTLQESSYETKIYVSEITSGNSQLLTTYSAKVTPDVFRYAVTIDLGGLRLGLYRLLTVVTLHGPIKLVGFYRKTFIHVR